MNIWVRRNGFSDIVSPQQVYRREGGLICGISGVVEWRISKAILWMETDELDVICEGTVFNDVLCNMEKIEVGLKVVQGMG